jgi:hypothetical protein
VRRPTGRRHTCPTGRRAWQCDERVNDGHVASLDGEGEQEQKLHVAIKDAYGDEQAEDAAEAAVERDFRKRELEEATRGIDGDGGERGADNGRGIEAGDPALAVQLFKKSEHEPERDQLECGSDDAGMDKAVREGLPESAVDKRAG